jgi:ubiquinone/menaquinone biosynthesis C-methylase UbiE
MAIDSADFLSFDRVAGCYDATRYIPPAVLRRTASLIVEDGGLTRDSLVLDAGIGTGRFARYMQDAGPRVVGADVSARMLGKAASLPRPPLLVRADLRALPFRSKSFDAALMVHVLHLVSEWKAVVAEVRRVLRPGAPLYLGSEIGKHFVSRSLYFQVAAEWKLTRPNLGAASFDAILVHMAATGAEVQRIDRDRLTWSAQVHVGEMLDTLKMNPFSHMWHIQPEVHRLLVAEAERRTREVFPTLDRVEEAAAALMLWRVVWP